MVPGMKLFQFIFPVVCLPMNELRVPDFIIGGAPRSGTTFLCHALSKHSDIYIAEPYIPEPKVLVTGDTSTESILARYAALFAPARINQRLVEKTSCYFENERALNLITRALPHVKMIFILREPVARAYSNYLRTRDQGYESLPFLEALSQEQLRENPFTGQKSYVQPHAYFGRGRYDLFAERYLRALGRERVHFCLFEDIVGQPEKLIRDLQDFMGVALRPWSELQTGRINGAAEQEAKLDSTLHAELKINFADNVRRFAELTQLDLAAWNYS